MDVFQKCSSFLYVFVKKYCVACRGMYVKVALSWNENCKRDNHTINMVVDSVLNMLGKMSTELPTRCE